MKVSIDQNDSSLNTHSINFINSIENRKMLGVNYVFVLHHIFLGEITRKLILIYIDLFYLITIFSYDTKVITRKGSFRGEAVKRANIVKVNTFRVRVLSILIRDFVDYFPTLKVRDREVVSDIKRQN